MSDPLLSTTEAAEYLGRPVAWTRQVIQGHRLGSRIRGRWYVQRSVLDEFVAKGAPDPPAHPIAVMPRRVVPFGGGRAA